MTHDEYDALPTADKLVLRNKELTEYRDLLTYSSGEAAYFRAVAEGFDAEASSYADAVKWRVAQIRVLQKMIDAEKATARAAKRQQAKEVTPVAEVPQ